MSDDEAGAINSVIAEIMPWRLHLRPALSHRHWFRVWPVADADPCGNRSSDRADIAEPAERHDCRLDGARQRRLSVPGQLERYRSGCRAQDLRHPEAVSAAARLARRRSATPRNPP